MVKRLSLGKWVDSSYRLRVSMAGYDVDNTSLTASQLIFDSTWSQTGFIILSGSFVIGGSVVFSSFTKVVSWTSLGYTPIVYLGATFTETGTPYWEDAIW